MPKPHATREARADRLLARMPSVPPAVRARFRTAFLAEEPKTRGVPKALEAFFARLSARGIAFENVRAEDFRAVTTSRSGFRALVAALGAHAPEVPLAAAAPVRREWDRWLNARYNAKPKRPRRSTRVVTLPGDWPADWQAALPALDETRRGAGRIFRPLAPRTRASVVQAVGMAETARTWAAGRGIALSATIDGDLAEVLVRYLTHERRVSARTIHDYLERVRIFALRGGLLAEDDHAAIGAILSDLHAEAADTDPAKRAKVRAFRRSFNLADVLLRARALGQEAAALPDWSARAARKRRAAVILALLVNTADRQGDLSCHRIGHELQREPDGSWSLDFHQSKTGRRKASGPLWPVTARLIEGHILAGRPDWCLPDRLAELEGCNLLSLAPRGFGLYHPSAILREEFGISGHLVRTLITDAVRNHRPDAAWAAQALMGHVNRTMQETYRVDFRETAAIKSWHDTLEALQARAG